MTQAVQVLRVACKRPPFTALSRVSPERGLHCSSLDLGQPSLCPEARPAVLSRSGSIPGPHSFLRVETGFLTMCLLHAILHSNYNQSPARRPVLKGSVYQNTEHLLQAPSPGRMASCWHLTSLLIVTGRQKATF